jgi:ubiquinone/menaquinone biosynthesis C-methylase UbiE
MKVNLDGLKKRSEVLEKGKVRDKTLLDVGAGPLAVIAAKQFGCKVTCIDISAEKLKEARKEAVREKVGQKIRFEQADATGLPYENSSFDVVVSYGTLHHIDPVKRKKFVREIWRVAREKIIVADYAPSHFPQVHPGGEYTAVDLDWLEKELRALGKVEKYPDPQMGVYICFKGTVQ